MRNTLPLPKIYVVIVVIASSFLSFLPTIYVVTVVIAFLVLLVFCDACQFA